MNLLPKRYFCFLAVIVVFIEVAHGQQNKIIIPKTISITRMESPMSGCLWSESDIIVPGGENFGRDPYIIVYPNADNTVSVAWLDRDKGQIHISLLNAKDSVIGEVKSKALARINTNLGGFLILPEDKSMVIGYTKRNKGNDGDEYWIMRMKMNGDTLWDRKIFGAPSMKVAYAQANIGSGGTSRLVHNPATGNIGIFLGHNQQGSDGITHQGSFIGFISKKGKVLKLGNNWYISHDMDQRIIVRDSLYFLLSHGDGYPRALVFSVWNDKEVNGRNPIVYSHYLEIPGKIGDNYTGCRTGGIVALSDGNFGIVYTTEITRKQMDVCYVKISPKGKILFTKWLSQNTEYDAKIPKIANRGKNRVLIAWKSDYATAEFRELDNPGNFLSKTSITRDYMDSNKEINFCFTHDLVTCPNGDIVWASGKCNDKKLIVYRIRYQD